MLEYLSAFDWEARAGNKTHPSNIPPPPIMGGDERSGPNSIMRPPVPNVNYQQALITVQPLRLKGTKKGYEL